MVSEKVGIPPLQQGKFLLYLPHKIRCGKYILYFTRLILPLTSHQLYIRRNMEILFYRKRFNRRFSIYDQFRMGEIGQELPEETELIFSDEPELLETADVVILDVPFLIGDVAAGRIPKYEGQVWVGWCMECEENYPWLKHPAVKETFDIWMTYRQNADIVLPYYDVSFLSKLMKPPHPKQADVCMLISSTVNQSRRLEYLLELMKWIPIDSYGRWQNNCTLPDDKGYLSKLEVIRKYRFTIAFENAVGEDYVTEKFYEPLLAGSVPVYWGAPNIDQLAPAKSAFVDVRSYPEPRLLAEQLRKWCQDEKAYMRFFDWKKHPMESSFVRKLEWQRTHPLLRLVNMLKEKRMPTPSSSPNTRFRT